MRSARPSCVCVCMSCPTGSVKHPQSSDIASARRPLSHQLHAPQALPLPSPAPWVAQRQCRAVASVLCVCVCVARRCAGPLAYGVVGQPRPDLTRMHHAQAVGRSTPSSTHARGASTVSGIDSMYQGHRNDWSSCPGELTQSDLMWCGGGRFAPHIALCPSRLRSSEFGCVMRSGPWSQYSPAPGAQHCRPPIPRSCAKPCAPPGVLRSLLQLVRSNASSGRCALLADAQTP